MYYYILYDYIPYVSQFETVGLNTHTANKLAQDARNITLRTSKLKVGSIFGSKCFLSLRYEESSLFVISIYTLHGKNHDFWRNRIRRVEKKSTLRTVLKK